MTTKAIFYLKGGNINHVISNSEDFQFKIVDYDNLPNGNESNFEYLEPDLIEIDIDNFRTDSKNN